MASGGLFTFGLLIAGGAGAAWYFGHMPILIAYVGAGFGGFLMFLALFIPGPSKPSTVYVNQNQSQEMYARTEYNPNHEIETVEISKQGKHCPFCEGDLIWIEAKNEYICRKCGKTFN